MVKNKRLQSLVGLVYEMVLKGSFSFIGAYSRQKSKRASDILLHLREVVLRSV